MNSGNIIRVGNGEIYIQDEDKQGWHICVPSDTFELFECDPEKNVNCTKEGCFINGGPCHETSHVEFAKKYESIIEALCEVGEVYLNDNDKLTLSVSRRFASDMINREGTPYIEFSDNGPKFSMEGRNNGNNSN